MTKSKLTKKDVLHVAELSNLKLTESEIEKYLPQLSKIVDFVGALSEVDTSDVHPTSQTTGLTNVLRDDVLRSSFAIKSDNSLTADEALSGTDNTQNDLFKVPAILSERSME